MYLSNNAGFVAKNERLGKCLQEHLETAVTKENN